MLVRLWKGSAATHGPGPMRDKNNACKGKENKVRVTRMVIIVIIVFAICWVPLQVILKYKPTCHSTLAEKLKVFKWYSGVIT